MKKLFFLVLVSSVTLLSCVSSKIYPVQNSYATLPITMNSESNFDQVWDRLVDLFAQNGLSIKLIDKNSGLIISDNSEITATWEDKNGIVVHPTAYIVTPKVKDLNLQTYVGIVGSYYKKSDLKKPGITRGEWNVRIKKVGTGTTINVNLVNVRYTSFDSRGVSMIKNLSEFKSTGNFEKTITDIIK